MAKNKLHVALAKTDHGQKVYSEGLAEYVRFFKDKQGAFRGERKTYEAVPGTIDIPSERSNKLVVTTVDEKLDWFKDVMSDYLNTLFSVEATNASGTVKTELVVDGISFGMLSSLELLRLKSIIENTNFVRMYEEIPVRNEDEIWNKSNADLYKNRDIYESQLMSGEKKTTTKEQFILQDPNLSQLKNSEGYKPQISSKDTITTLGSFTFQKYSGEWSHRQRAEVLKRRSVLLNAVIEALKVANEAELIQSNLTSEKLFNYLHNGK